jgi:hypothetical protein
MADQKISAMPSAATLDGTEITPIVQSGTNKQVTTANYVSQVLNVNPALTTQGGTNIKSYTLGDTLYASATNVLSKLSGNTTSTQKFLAQTGTGSASAAPAWTALSASSINAGYGCFVSTANQANGGATTANLVSLDTQIVTASGLSNASGVITFTTAGVYQLIVELFFTSTTGANPTISQWLSQNGSNIANSTQDFQLLGGANTVQASACAWHVSVNASDTLRIYWSSSNTNVSLAYQGALTNPTRPASPSAIITLQQVA